eukprot:ANDGO_07513.mRNA.1 hypothetical protein
MPRIVNGVVVPDNPSSPSGAGGSFPAGGGVLTTEISSLGEGVKFWQVLAVAVVFGLLFGIPGLLAFVVLMGVLALYHKSESTTSASGSSSNGSGSSSSQKPTGVHGIRDFPQAPRRS